MNNKIAWAVTAAFIFIVIMTVSVKFDEVNFTLSNGKTKIEVNGKSQIAQEVNDHPPVPSDSTSSVSITQSVQSSHGSQSPNQSNQNGNNVYIGEMQSKH